MDEALFAQLAARLTDQVVVLASVIETRGATPRHRGARMLISSDWSFASIGGGMAEARVLAAARAVLLAQETDRTVLDIDLGGGADAAGVCGGRMRLALRRWHGAHDRARAQSIANQLAAGHAVELDADALGAKQGGAIARPNPRLLIIGAGHCGAALYRLAALLDFDLCVHDARADCLRDGGYAARHVIHGEADALLAALDTARPVYAVLLNRDFQTDIASLDVLSRQPPAFIGMMGSHRRIQHVRAALPQHAELLARVVAPVGLSIDAETPEEIAVGILAQLIAFRAQAAATRADSTQTTGSKP